MNELTTIKEKRATLLANVKTINETAKTEKRDLTPEESVKVDGLFAEFDTLGQRAKTLESQTQLERSEAELREFQRRSDPGRPARHAEPERRPGEAVRAWLLRGRSGARLGDDELDNARRCGVDFTSNELVVNYEQRQMTTSASTAGLGLVQWREFYNGYDKALKFYGGMLNIVRRLNTATGATMPIPKFDDTANSGRWLGETTTVTETLPTVGSTTLSAYKASSDEIPISIELLQDSQAAAEQFIPEFLGERIGRLLNTALTVGDGSGKPTGLIPGATASTIVAAGTAAAPAPTIDNFLDLKYSVDPAYRNAPPASRGFMMHDTTLAKLRKLKDGNSRYFADPFTSGPGTLDGDPIFLNNDVPTAGVSVRMAAYGDYSRYIARETMSVTFYRLDQIRIRDGVIVFMAFARWDGKLIQAAAVKTLASAAS